MQFSKYGSYFSKYFISSNPFESNVSQLWLESHRFCCKNALKFNWLSFEGSN